MKKRWIIIPALIVLIAGCETEESVPEQSGTFILSSEKILAGESYVVYGFSFEQSELIRYSITQSKKPDLLLTDSTNVANEIIGGILTSPSNDDAFHLEGEFASAGEALSFYENYTQVTATRFSMFGRPVHKNQVWTVQTARETYAKILIKSVAIISAGNAHVEAEIQWHYQKDGSGDLSGTD